MRRELAAWLMSVRFRLAEVHDELRAVLRESDNPGSLLHGEFDDVKLSDASVTLHEMMSSDLPDLLFPCNRADPVAVARGFEKSWNLNPTANAGQEGA